jgi:GNAT superfamily N-acetyltransferase
MSPPPSDVLLSVRPATVGDTAEVVRLAALMYETLGMGTDDRQWRQTAAHHLATRLGHDAAVFVVDDPSNPGQLAAIGAATITRRLPAPHNPGATVGYIQWISTDPAWRRRGLARRVTGALLDWLRDNDVRTVELHAARDAEALYRSMGFADGTNPALRTRLQVK